MIVDRWGGRVGDDEMGRWVLGNEVVGKDVVDVGGIEEGVVDGVEGGVEVGMVDGLGEILDGEEVGWVRWEEVGDGRCRGVEVVEEVVGGKWGKVGWEVI